METEDQTAVTEMDGVLCPEMPLRCLVAPLILAALLNTAAARADDDHLVASPGWVYFAQTGAGLLANFAGLAAGRRLCEAATDNSGTFAEMLFSLPIASTASAGMVYIIGTGARQQGRFIPALGFTAGVQAAATTLALVGERITHGGGLAMQLVAIGLYLGSPLAGVVGYDRSGPHGGFSSRIQPGMVAIGIQHAVDGEPTTVLTARLFSISF